MLQPLRDFPLLRNTFNEGEAKGKAEGKAEALLDLLQSRGLTLSESVRAMVSTCTDLERISAWWQRALKPSSSLDDIFA